MHKNLKDELVSLAHSILEMKNNENVDDLHKKARDIYEKFSVLKFVDSHVNVAPNLEEKEVKIVDKIELNIETKEEVLISSSNELIEEDEKPETISEAQVEEIFGIEDTFVKDDVKEIPLFQNSLEEELKDAISSDVATELFERVTKEHPEVKEKSQNQKRSLNDSLYDKNLQVGLNDRIAFVKHLFEGNQEDFNRVLSQLNSFDTEVDAKDFIHKMVKPDYDWSSKEEYEERLIAIIERKFL